MPRRSLADKVQAQILTDPHLRVLGYVYQGLFHALILLMVQLGGEEDPRLGFGADPGSLGSLAELHMLLGVRGTEQETQLETQMETLVARGCLRRGPDGTLRPPLALAPTARQLAARLNGARGGRPRKDGLPPQQREMVLALPGGRGDETQRNPSETQERAMPPPKLKQETQASKLPIDEQVFHETGRAVLTIAEFDETRGMANYGLVRQWLADGATPETILATVRQVADRMRARGNPAQHLGAFKGAIAEAVASQAPVYPPAEAAARKRWNDDMTRYQQRCREVGYVQSRMPEMPDLQAYLAEARAA